jgi:HlyD family secretion protein
MTDSLSLPTDETAPLTPLSDSPIADLRLAGAVVGGFLAIMLGWATLAQLDSAARAPGRVSVYGHDQIVAHREGGVLARIDVTEGQHVRAGQELAQLAPDEIGAEVAALRSHIILFRAQQARLEAETQGLTHIPWPPLFGNLVGYDLAAATAAIQAQQAQLDVDLRTMRLQSAAASSRAQGLIVEVAAGQGELQSNVREQELLNQQLVGVRSLAAKGFAPQNSLRALERSDAELQSSHDQIQANIAQYRQQITESALTAASVRSQFVQAALTALRQTDEELAEATPKLQAADAQLQRGTLRAQTDGVVTGLSVFSPGAVVPPGQELMEIVPTNPRLVVETKLAAADIEGARVGQQAEVRLAASGGIILKGTLTELSADSFVDEHTGRAFYTATVTVPETELHRVAGANGDRDILRPGLPVEVMIPIQRRSALDYLLGPLQQSLWRSFRQR